MICFSVNPYQFSLIDEISTSYNKGLLHVRVFKNLFLFILVFSFSFPTISQAQQQEATPVFVFDAVKDLIHDEIEALGTLKSNESVDITANVTEKVNAIYFEDGDLVEKDTVLIEMTSAEEKALLEEARATLSEAKRQYDRVKPLVEKKTASEALLDQRQREYKTAQARLAAIESQMDDRIVKAPFSGQLGFREISVGTLVEPGDMVTTIDQIDVLKLDFDVPSIFLGDLKRGDIVVAMTDSYPNKEFQARIDTVGTRIDPETRTLRYRALIQNPDMVLKPGLLMSMVLKTNERDAVMIPESAIKPIATKTFVYVINGDSVAEREVKTGARQEGYIEIVEGVNVDDQVVIHGVMKIKDGAKVNISGTVDRNTNIQDLLESNASQEQQPQD